MKDRAEKKSSQVSFSLYLQQKPMAPNNILNLASIQSNLKINLNKNLRKTTIRCTI